MVSPVYIKPLLALLVIAAIISIAAVVLRNSPHGAAPELSANQKLPHNIDVALKKARFTEIQDGLVVWELVAERVDYDKDGDMAYLSDIRMEFQKTRSHGAVTVTADSGEYTSLAKDVRLNGHVHVTTEDGGSFKTDSIVYNGAAAKLSTTDPVVFRQQRLQLTAVGMDLSVNNQTARFFSSVVATIISRQERSDRLSKDTDT
jgi:LPS export ABC transporter protein LptC